MCEASRVNCLPPGYWLGLELFMLIDLPTDRPLNYLCFNCCAQEMKLEEYMYRSQLPRMLKIMNSYESAANILIELQDDDLKYKVSVCSLI